MEDGYLGVSPSMWIILLEAGAALALLVLIVWWTLPRRKGKGDDRRG